ncbi:MAG TPA: GNAT family N-acetyltransferase [Streptosporangiaceae bacterium]|nr:GNAT family N-acetyltransferase [Streptosporangiaceae bacterium]
MTPHTSPAAPGVTVVRAAEADTDVLSQVIADAFHDLAPSQWLIPDPDARREAFPGYFRLYVEHAMTVGVVYTTLGRTAAALWLPIGEEGPGEDPGYGERLAAATHPWTARFVAFDRVLERHHPVGAAHHHLAVLAVRPDAQRQGIGTAMLNAHHVTLDQTGTPAYLEASSLHARRIYLRHSYADHGLPIHLAKGPLMHPMWRRPATAPGSLRPLILT